MSMRILCCLAFAWLAGCNAFDPELPDKPFRCGQSEPACPEGYVCTGEVCEKKVGDTQQDAPVTIDARVIDAPEGIECDDAEEPNNVTGEATYTGIPEDSIDHRYVDLSICGDDVDLFRFSLNSGQVVQVQVETGDGAPLALAILTETGESIAEGEPVDGDPTRLELTATPPAGMDYFAEVRAVAGGENSYEIFIAAVIVP